MLRRLLPPLLCLTALLQPGAAAAEPLTVCYHYGCDRSSQIELIPEATHWLEKRLQAARSATEERAALQDVVLAYYQFAAQVAPIAADKGGNGEDAANLGRMDCLDHSQNIAALLQSLNTAQALRYYTDITLVHRAPLVFNQHTAVAISNTEHTDRWVIDGWFRDFGAPPVVVPLAIWMEGFSP